MRFQLDHILSEVDPREIMTAVLSIPNDLPVAYKEILKRIENRSKGAKRLVLRILSWIFLSGRPLTMDELREVLSVREGDRQLNPMYLLDPGRIIDVCESLVVHDPASRQVRFTHYTLHEFLQQSEDILVLSVPDLATICLTYLTFNVFEEGPCATKEQLERRMESHKFSRFAERLWSVYTQGQGEESPAVRKAILRLFGSTRKMSSMAQMGFACWGLEDYVSCFYFVEQTWLHIVESRGLTTIGKLFLNGTVDELTLNYL